MQSYARSPISCGERRSTSAKVGQGRIHNVRIRAPHALVGVRKDDFQHAPLMSHVFVADVGQAGVDEEKKVDL